MYLYTQTFNDGDGVTTRVGYMQSYDACIQEMMIAQKVVCSKNNIDYEQVETAENWEESSVENDSATFSYWTEDGDDYYIDIRKADINTIYTTI